MSAETKQQRALSLQKVHCPSKENSASVKPPAQAIGTKQATTFIVVACFVLLARACCVAVLDKNSVTLELGGESIELE